MTKISFSLSFHMVQKKVFQSFALGLGTSAVTFRRLKGGLASFLRLRELGVCETWIQPQRPFTEFTLKDLP